MTAEPPTLSAQDKRMGPGRLVLVAGPSGAGKDSVIAAVRAMLRSKPQFVFPRRVITRGGSAHEDHESLSAADFETAKLRGAFALSWSAHELSYGIPASINAEIQSGRTVICNVSRTVVVAAREMYAHVLFVEITAPEDVLRARLLSRGRETPADIDRRLVRRLDGAVIYTPDVVIENDATVEHAASLFLAAMGAPRVLCDSLM